MAEIDGLSHYMTGDLGSAEEDLPLKDVARLLGTEHVRKLIENLEQELGAA